MNEGITKEELIEQFKGNKILKTATTVVGLIVLVVLLFVGYSKFISGPKNERSQAAVAKGIMLMESDSIAAAIDELSYVASEYSGYDGAHLANYSLGNLYFEQGRYDDALEALLKVKLDDTYLMTLTIGAIGDCYSELSEYNKAVKQYVKAAERTENDLTTPMYLFKAGLNAEEAGDFVTAKKHYLTIKSQFTTYANQKGIEKYITRAEGKL